MKKTVKIVMPQKDILEILQESLEEHGHIPKGSIIDSAEFRAHQKLIELDRVSLIFSEPIKEIK